MNKWGRLPQFQIWITDFWIGEIALIVSFKSMQELGVLARQKVSVCKLFLGKCLLTFADETGNRVLVLAAPAFGFKLNLCIHFVGHITYFH